MTQFPSWVQREGRARSYQGSGRDLERSHRVFAIAFDMGLEALRVHYKGHPTQSWHDVRRILESHGFQHQQGTLYFGTPNMSAVHCVVAVQDVQKTFPWFAKVVKDIRMLRIEEDNNLMPAIGQQDLFPPKAANE